MEQDITPPAENMNQQENIPVETPAAAPAPRRRGRPPKVREAAAPVETPAAAPAAAEEPAPAPVANTENIKVTEV